MNRAEGLGGRQEELRILLVVESVDTAQNAPSVQAAQPFWNALLREPW